MPFAVMTILLQYSRNQVKRAGKILLAPGSHPLALQGLVTVALAHEDRGVFPVSVQVAVRGDRSLLIHDAVEALEEYARSIQSDTEDLAAASG